MTVTLVSPDLRGHQVRTRISSPTAERGMAVAGPDGPEIVLTVDVARITAAEAGVHD